MQIVSFRHNNKNCLGLRIDDDVANITEAGGPEDLDSVLKSGPEAVAELKKYGENAKSRIAYAEITEFLSPVRLPSKVIAAGLNYKDHATEVSHHETPTHPHLFSRYPTSWVAHNQAIIKPKSSPALDYEGEVAVIIGKAGRRISKENALSHVAGYSIFNEGSVRDVQMRTPQWTMGKNFDSSGSFGPCFVTADALPKGASGLKIQTRLNGELLQDANTRDMIFDVATLIEICSEAFELRPGDVILSGTPSGIGGMRKPPIFMQAGDVCEISVEGIGVLSNPVKAEA